MMFIKVHRSIAYSIAAMIALLLVSCQQDSSSQPQDGRLNAESINTVVVSKEQQSVPDQVDFNEHVQPILSEYCYHCHGPDSGTREPKAEPYRLDIAADALAVRENGKSLIIPGDPINSEVVKRMHLNDPHEIMPPPESHKTMNKEEIAILEKWIEQGAEYKDHWSFIKPEKAKIPESSNPEWKKNPIDSFVLEKLEQEGLSPNKEEAPHRLFRRMSQDLRGLPPTPQEVETFLASYEANPDAAIERAAEEMMKTTAYAEHFTRHWLDAVRYADTHGIHIDNARSIWPYRDWVIGAYQNNMLFDQFTIEQMAGDLLDDPSIDQLVATGYNRCLPTTNEGGVIPEEYEVIYATDRVETTSAVWLGLTTGCAACHDHKFDPISAKEFYEMSAFFRNNEMPPLDGNSYLHKPFIALPTKEDEIAVKENKKKIDQAEENINQILATVDASSLNWSEIQKNTKPIDSYVHLPFTTNDPKSIKYRIGNEEGSFEAELHVRKDELGPYVHQEHWLKGSTLGNVNSEGSLDGFTLAGHINLGTINKDGEPIQKSPLGTMLSLTDEEKRGIGVQVSNFKLRFVDFRKNAVVNYRLETVDEFEPGRWYHVAFVYEKAKTLKESFKLYIDGNLAQLNVLNDVNEFELAFNGKLHWGKLSEHTGRFYAADSRYRDFHIFKRALSEEEMKYFQHKALFATLLDAPDLKEKKEGQEALTRLFVYNNKPEAVELLAQRARLFQKRYQIKKNIPHTLIMQERKETEPKAHVLIRGDYQNKGEEVGAGVPSFMNALPSEGKKDRLALAKWLVDRENPLTARVTVNRYWYYLFGRGIVETTEDFGIMGSRPSHPKLLDWLAVDFMENNWNLHHLLKTIVTSKTYRQASTFTPEKLEQDPDNTLLSRGPRYRLDAEQIRDLALASSGLLSNTTGGPPVKPYQPEGIWTIAMAQSNTKNYVQDEGDKLYRRSLYTFWKRQAPPPSMEILNAPTRETFCVRRDRTNTPLQAFVTLNDTQFIESSRHLAQRAMQQATSIKERIDFIYQHLLSRSASDKEFVVLEKSHQKISESFVQSPENASKLLSVGESKADENLDAVELASWTMLASQVFNLDENLNK